MTQTKRKQHIEMQEWKRKAEQTEENRTNMKIFVGFQDEYRAMVDELLREIKARESVIDQLSTKLDINDKRHREYRFSFGNVSLLEDRLQKMESVYVSKLSNCFDHYTKTVEVVVKESKKVMLLANKLKQDYPAATRPVSGLLDIVKSLEVEVSCFEKFLAKYRNIREISQVVEEYVENKQEIKKSINRVIYLDELAKFKNKKKSDDLSTHIKAAAYQTLDTLDHNFRALNKEQRRPLRPKLQSPTGDGSQIGDSTGKLPEASFPRSAVPANRQSASSRQQFFAHKSSAPGNFKISRMSSSSHLKHN